MKHVSVTCLSKWCSSGSSFAYSGQNMGEFGRMQRNMSEYGPACVCFQAHAIFIYVLVSARELHAACHARVA